MPYVYKMVKTGQVIEIRKYYSSRYGKKCKKRDKRKSFTKEEQLVVNERVAAQKLRWKINSNFGYGDVHIVLDYDPKKRPKDNEEMREHINKFLRELRKVYKKANSVLKYVSVMEVGKKGARHHHLVINVPEGVREREIMQTWDYGRVHFNYLDKHPNYAALADYLIKQSSNYFRTEGAMQKKRWCCSRNMKQPVVLVEKIVKNKGWYNRIAVVPKKLQGKYYIDEDMTREGIHERTGYPYFAYTLIKINTSKKGLDKE